MLVLSLVPSLAPSPASADDVPLSELVRRRVDEELVKPLAERESSHFSRVRPPPRERRIRVLDASPVLDPQRRSFLRFAVDVRFGSDWHKDDVVGCAYPATGALFVKIGETYRPASLLLGKAADPVADVCVPAR